MANASEPPEESGDAGEVLGYVKVMTNDPMEALQKQISIYATICEQLVEMHRAFTEHQDSIAAEAEEVEGVDGKTIELVKRRVEGGCSAPGGGQN
uniref:Uncharacterized protein n=1 Tax=Aegilops tauschii TaxID=37682 RepID=M8CAP8_AEGTA